MDVVGDGVAVGAYWCIAICTCVCVYVLWYRVDFDNWSVPL